MNRYLALTVFMVLACSIAVLAAMSGRQESTRQAHTEIDKPTRYDPDSEREKALLQKLKALLDGQGIQVDPGALNKHAESSSCHHVSFAWEAYLNAPKHVEVDDPRYQRGSNISITGKMPCRGNAARHNQIEVPFRGGFFIVGVDDKGKLAWWTQIPDPRTEFSDVVLPSGEIKGETEHKSTATFSIAVPDGLGITNIRFFRCIPISNSCRLELFQTVAYR